MRTKPSAASNECCRESDIALRQFALAAAYRRARRFLWFVTILVLCAAAGVIVMACTGHKPNSYADAVAAQSKQDWAGARDKWRSAAADNPTPHAFVQQATCEYEAGQHEAALKTCERFRATAPVRYHQIRGIVFFKQGRHNDAALAFHKMATVANTYGTAIDQKMAADLLRACGGG